VLLNDGPIGGGQGSLFINEPIANAYLSDIMEIRGDLKFISFFGRKGEPLGNKIGIITDSF
jgi:hypothetical protein